MTATPSANGRDLTPAEPATEPATSTKTIAGFLGGALTFYVSDVFENFHGAWTWGAPLVGAAALVVVGRAFRGRNAIMASTATLFGGACMGVAVDKFVHWSLPSPDIVMNGLIVGAVAALVSLAYIRWGESAPVRRIKAAFTKVKIFFMGD